MGTPAFAIYYGMAHLVSKLENTEAKDKQKDGEKNNQRANTAKKLKRKGHAFWDGIFKLGDEDGNKTWSKEEFFKICKKNDPDLTSFDMDLMFSDADKDEDEKI